MSAGRVLLIVGGCWLGACVLGAFVGWVLGHFAPGFVIGLFAMDVDPVSTGVGLGVVNGGIAGIVVGILAVLVEAFGKRR